MYLDSSEHMAVMLEAAAELDRDLRSRTNGRRAAVALPMLGGLRTSAAGALLGRDQDLANGRIEVGILLGAAKRTGPLLHRLQPANSMCIADDRGFPSRSGATLGS